MKFDQLPQELIASVMKRCDYPTVVQMSRTSNKMDKIRKAYHLDKVDVKDIIVVLSENNLRVEIFSSKFEANTSGYRKFDRTFNLSGVTDQMEQMQKAHEIIHNMLTSIKSVNRIMFEKITVDDAFVKMFKDIPLDWKNVALQFEECSYAISKEVLVPFWKMFKTVCDYDSIFYDEETDIFHDEMMLQTLPSITLNNTDRFELEYNPNLTDRTLEFLAENRPPGELNMSRFIVDFTPVGIKQLFNTIVSSRDPSIDYWFLGTMELELEAFFQLLRDFEHFNTEFSIFHYEPNLMENLCTMTVIYKKEDSNEVGNLSIALAKPHEVVDAEHRWNQLNQERWNQLNQERWNQMNQDVEMIDENNNNEMEF